MIPADEVAEQLRKALAREVTIRLFDRKCNWNAKNPVVKFFVGDWKMTFFNDCGELDYTEMVEAPDGRTGEFLDWFEWNQTGCPLDWLSERERNQLEALLASAGSD